MSKNIKTLRVAVAGATSDGRTIEPSWLSDIAETYNPKTYGARCWIEHIRSAFADSAFPAVGDILGAFTKTEEVNGEEKLCLYATIKALPQLIDINKKGQKIYSSIEVEPNFSKTGKAYLMGLGFTDSPSSIGTEALKFNSHAKENPTHVFSEACETQLFDSLEYSKKFAQECPEAQPLLDHIAGLETQVQQFSEQPPQTPPATPEQPQSNSGDQQQSPNFSQLFADFEQKFNDALSPLNEKLDALQKQNQEFAEFKQQLEDTEFKKAPKHSGNGDNRPAASF